MTYTVFWKRLPGEAIISERGYESLDEATAASTAVVADTGPSSIEITVVDGNGLLCSTRVANNA